jgi:hypothetical protein
MQLQMKVDPCTRVRFKMGLPATNSYVQQTSTNAPAPPAPVFKVRECNTGALIFDTVGIHF